MVGQKLFFHSPLSPISFSQKESPSLLLRLIIHELIQADYLIETPPLDLAPFSWATKAGSKNKIQEYVSLLTTAFPHLAKESKKIEANLDQPCNKLVSYLEPFITACRTNENLLFFLLKHEKSVSIKSILDKICPGQLTELRKTITHQYKKRGFRIPRWSR